MIFGKGAEEKNQASVKESGRPDFPETWFSQLAGLFLLLGVMVSSSTLDARVLTITTTVRNDPQHRKPSVLCCPYGNTHHKVVSASHIPNSYLNYTTLPSLEQGNGSH
jgi:hypothetical protein